MDLNIASALIRRLGESLRLEFLGRPDEVRVFRKLMADRLRRICAREIAREALEFLSREDFDPQLGARPLRKIAER